MRQLSRHDAGFLYADTVHAYANVTFVQIYDPSTAPGGAVRFKSILAHIQGRLHQSPIFRSKLLRVPFELDEPYWVEDEYFDLEYHVRHIALPKPGDWRQFCIQASRLHARALDMDRPPWELYVIEGLDSFLDLPEGSFAVLLKTHLAALDLSELTKLTESLCDTKAKPVPLTPPPSWFADSPPAPLALLQRSMLRSALMPWQLPWAAERMLPMARIFTGGGLAEVHPMTRFNSVVSPHRIFETRRFMVEEFEEIAALVPGATLEDAVIAVCGGALRQYLYELDELPASESLNALVWQAAEAADGQGKPSWRPRSLGTDVAEPGERLVAVTASASKYPEVVQQAIRPAFPVVQMPGQPSTHCIIRFIPAPQETQYLCGAHLSYTSAILPVRDGTGLAFAVTQYEGRVVISPTACRELVPDPEHFAQCLRDSFQASLALARQGGSEKPAARRKGKTG